MSDPIPTSRSWRNRLLGWGKEALITIAMMAVVFMAVRWVQHQGQKGGGGALVVGMAAPTIQVSDARDGATRAVSDLVGTPTILKFWAPWCTFCTMELPGLEGVADAAKDEGFNFITISSEPPESARAWLDEHDLPYAIWWDKRHELSKAYGVTKLPTTVILDASGAVVHDFNGGADADILLSHMRRLAP